MLLMFACSFSLILSSLSWQEQDVGLDLGHIFFLLWDWNIATGLGANILSVETLTSIPGLSLSKCFSFQMSHITRKPVFRVSDQVRLKPGCAASEAS